MVAHHWRIDPFILSRYPARTYRLMVQIRERQVQEHNEAVKAAQSGIPSEMIADERRKAREAHAESKRRGLKKDKPQKPGPADW